MALLPPSEPETNAAEREFKEMRAEIIKNPLAEAFVDEPLNLLTQISDTFNSVGKIESTTRAGTLPALKLALTTQTQRFQILKTVYSQRFFARMFNRYRFDIPEVSAEKTRTEEHAEEIVDMLTNIDWDFHHFLNRYTSEFTPEENTDRRKRRKAALMTLARTLPGKLLFYTKNSEINTVKPKSAEDRRVRTDYGSYNLGYTKEQFAKMERLLVPNGKEAAAKDMTHQVTAIIMYELLSRKIMVHYKMLADLYTHTAESGALSFSHDIESTFKRNEKNGYVKDKEYKQWLQSGAVKLPFDSLTVNIGNVGEIAQLTIDLPSEMTMFAFYRGDRESLEAVYGVIRSAVAKKLLTPDKIMLVDQNVVEEAFQDIPGAKDAFFAPADVQVNFARESTMDLNRIIELNNITGNPINATHHVHTLYLDEETQELSGMQTRTHHPKNFGKVEELLMNGEYPEFDALAQVLSTVPIDATESIHINQFERSLLERAHEQPVARMERVARAQKEIPTVLRTVVLEKPIRDALRFRIDRLNGRVKKEIFRLLDIQKENDYLISLDTLITFAVGLSGNMFDTDSSCVHMNFLVETPQGDISPCLLPIPWNESFTSYASYLETPDQFIASKERGMRIAQAFGFFTKDKHLALDRNAPASLSVRLALAAGGLKAVFQSMSGYTDAKRGQYIQAGKGGLSSRLGKFKRFTPATTDYYIDQPSVAIIENESGNREVTIEIDKAKQKLPDNLAGHNGEKLKLFLDFVLKDLEAYEDSLPRFLDLRRFRNY